MQLPDHLYQTTNISLATALLCTDYAYVFDGLPNERISGGDIVHISTEVIDGTERCVFNLGYSNEEEFTRKCSSFSGGSLMIHPVHYDRKKKIIRDSMHESRNNL